MTFTDADHDKAVELYQRFKDAEWWPERTAYREGSWCIGTIQGVPVLTISQFHALSAIAWAMVERLGDVDLYHDPDKGYIEYGQGVIGSTRFLALAAAVEGME